MNVELKKAFLFLTTDLSKRLKRAYINGAFGERGLENTQNKVCEIEFILCIEIAKAFNLVEKKFNLEPIDYPKKDIDYFKDTEEELTEKEKLYFNKTFKQMSSNALNLVFPD